MSDDKRYNGWRNYETWCVNLWIDNEAALYEQRRETVAEMIRNCIDDEGDLDRDAATRDIAKWLQDWVEDEIPETYMPDTVGRVMSDASLYTDLLRAALGEVDWDEIAEHDVADQADEILAEAKAARAVVAEGA